MGQHGTLPQHSPKKRPSSTILESEVKTIIKLVTKRPKTLADEDLNDLNMAVVAVQPYQEQ